MRRGASGTAFRSKSEGNWRTLEPADRLDHEPGAGVGAARLGPSRGRKRSTRPARGVLNRLLLIDEVVDEHLDPAARSPAIGLAAPIRTGPILPIRVATMSRQAGCRRQERAVHQVAHFAQRAPHRRARSMSLRLPSSRCSSAMRRGFLGLSRPSWSARVLEGDGGAIHLHYRRR